MRNVLKLQPSSVAPRRQPLSRRASALSRHRVAGRPHVAGTFHRFRSEPMDRTRPPDKQRPADSLPPHRPGASLAARVAARIPPIRFADATRHAEPFCRCRNVKKLLARWRRRVGNRCFWQIAQRPERQPSGTRSRARLRASRSDTTRCNHRRTLLFFADARFAAGHHTPHGARMGQERARRQSPQAALLP